MEANSVDFDSFFSSNAKKMQQAYNVYKTLSAQQKNGSLSEDDYKKFRDASVEYSKIRKSIEDYLSEGYKDQNAWQNVENDILNKEFEYEQDVLSQILPQMIETKLKNADFSNVDDLFNVAVNAAHRTSFYGCMNNLCIESDVYKEVENVIMSVCSNSNSLKDLNNLAKIADCWLEKYGEDELNKNLIKYNSFFVYKDDEI